MTKGIGSDKKSPFLCRRFWPRAVGLPLIAFLMILAYALPFGNPQWHKYIYLFQWKIWSRTDRQLLQWGRWAGLGDGRSSPPHMPPTYTGVWTHWYENGQEKVRSVMRNGNPRGLHTTWHENGQKASAGTMMTLNWSAPGAGLSGSTYKPEGVWTYWHENGRKKTVGAYKTGARGQAVRAGEWVWRDQSGKIVVRGEYRNGKPWSGTFCRIHPSHKSVRFEPVIVKYENWRGEVIREIIEVYEQGVKITKDAARAKTAAP